MHEADNVEADFIPAVVFVSLPISPGLPGTADFESPFSLLCASLFPRLPVEDPPAPPGSAAEALRSTLLELAGCPASRSSSTPLFNIYLASGYFLPQFSTSISGTLFMPAVVALPGTAGFESPVSLLRASPISLSHLRARKKPIWRWKTL